MPQNSIKAAPPLLKEVAVAADVSPSTASLIFSGTGRISEATKTRVLRVAKEMGYVHQKREGKTIRMGSHVAILISIDKEWSFVWHFLTDMIVQIEQKLDQVGLKTVLIPISHHEDDEVIYQKIKKIGCRGVYSVHIGKDKLFEKLEKQNIPVIVIMNNNYQDKHFSICVDDFQGAYEGTRHLLTLGHRRIDFVDTRRADLPILSTDRYYGYRKAIEEAGMQFHESHRIGCEAECNEDNLEELFKEALSGDSPPTALFCLDDELAFRTWNALNRLGYSVPEEISIIAPGDVLDYSKPYVPPITTMHIDMTYVGRLAVDMLRNRLGNKIETVHVLKIKQQLTERGSCRAPAQ